MFFWSDKAWFHLNLMHFSQAFLFTLRIKLSHVSEYGRDTQMPCCSAKSAFPALLLDPRERWAGSISGSWCTKSGGGWIPFTFLLSAFYGNECRQSGAMNGIWWIQGYREIVETAVVSVDLFIQEGLVERGAFPSSWAAVKKTSPLPL